MILNWITDVDDFLFSRLRSQGSKDLIKRCLTDGMLSLWNCVASGSFIGEQVRPSCGSACGRKVETRISLPEGFVLGSEITACLFDQHLSGSFIHVLLWFSECRDHTQMCKRISWFVSREVRTNRLHDVTRWTSVLLPLLQDKALVRTDHVSVTKCIVAWIAETGKVSRYFAPKQFRKFVSKTIWLLGVHHWLLRRISQGQWKLRQNLTGTRRTRVNSKRQWYRPYR